VFLRGSEVGYLGNRGAGAAIHDSEVSILGTLTDSTPRTILSANGAVYIISLA
jgi:hypothetical protein